MCGLCGVYSLGFSAPEYDIFQKLLFLNYFRGRDSTGVIRVGQDNTIRTKKSLLSSPVFLETDHCYEFVSDSLKGAGRPVILMGHTRAATVGSVSIKNAHPFSFENVVGMHNGTVNKIFKHTGEYETDSEALYRNINDYGIDAALNEIARHDSAYALQWIDKQEGTLNFIRNDKRPLWFTFLYNRSTLVWSSDRRHIDFMLAVRGTVLNQQGWDPNNQTEKYFTLNPNELLSFKIGEPLPQAGRIRKIDVKMPTYYSSVGSYGYGRFRDDIDYMDGWEKRNGTYVYVGNRAKDAPFEVDPPQETKKSLTKKERKALAKQKGLTDGERALAWLPGVKKEEPLSATVHDLFRGSPAGPAEPVPNGEDEFLGFRGHRCTENHYRYLMGLGCFNCGAKFDLNNEDDREEAKKVHFWSKDEWACDFCYQTNEWVRESFEEDEATSVRVH